VLFQLLWVQVVQEELVVQVVEMVQMYKQDNRVQIQFFQALLLQVVAEEVEVIELLIQMQVMEVQVVAEVQVHHIQVLLQEQEEQVILLP
tara:strand:+ start:87 stop:356 length:270 start_codon:yes stop_codon:yes gene_type:complete